MDNLGRLLLEKFESISDASALNDTAGRCPIGCLRGNKKPGAMVGFK
jgi:hypothetical protein